MRTILLHVRSVGNLQAAQEEKRGLARIPAVFREFVPVPRFFRSCEFRKYSLFNRALLLVIIPLVSAGCAQGGGHRAAGAERENISLESQADYARLWSVSLRVVGARFPIKSAEETPGTIQTDYLTGALSQTGFRSNAVTWGEVVYDALHTTRRRATVTVGVSEETPVAVVVEKERLIRIRGDVLPAGTYSLDWTRNAVDTTTNSRWAADGRDAALEARILHEIEARFRAGSS